MTKTTLPVIPGEHRETRNPSACSGMLAGVGMTDGIVPSVSVHPISVQRYGVLRTTDQQNQWVNY